MTISIDAATALVSDALAVKYLQTDPEDELTALFVNAATAICEQDTMRKLAARDYTDARPMHDPYRSKWLIVPEWPINAITRIRVFDGDLENPDTLDADDYAFLPDQPHKILLKDGTWVEGYRIAIDYNGGYGYVAGPPADYDPELVPNDLIDACLEILAMIWKHQDGKHFITETRSIQGFSQTIRQDPIPPRAKRILARYARPSYMAI